MNSQTLENIVTWRLKSGICEKYECLLGNGSLKRILMSTNIQQRFPWIRGILGSPGVPATTGQETKRRTVRTRVEEGSNTSTVALRVVGGDEKGSLESETVKYGHESYGTRTRKWLRWRGPVTIENGRPVLSSERAPQTNKPATVRQ
jgi:hypothetical protein